MSEPESKIYDTIQDVDEGQWDNLVYQSDMGSFFQTSAWLRAMEEGLPQEPAHVVVKKSGHPIGVFPNFVTYIYKKPFRKLDSTTPGFGGPVISTDEQQVLELMFEEIDDACSGSILTHDVTTLDTNYVRYSRYMEQKGYEPDLELCRFVVDLRKGWDEIESEMDCRKRSNLRKAHENDFEIVEEDLTGDTIDSFHEVYVEAMERVGGDPLPKSFFTALAEHVENRTTIFTLFVDGERSGSHLYFEDLEQSTLHHYLSAVSEENFSKYPSELIHEHAMNYAIEKEYDTYDLGGTNTDYDDSLFQYKSEFGAKPVTSISWTRPYSHVGWGFFRTGRYFYRKLTSP